ncbi:hypothetical protein K1719_025426 [Acacia pycnantha]|nr:hypothetical protein K1719_025426 [Acacia pycnantha]
MEAKKDEEVMIEAPTRPRSSVASLIHTSLVSTLTVPIHASSVPSRFHLSLSSCFSTLFACLLPFSCNFDLFSFLILEVAPN